MAVTQLNSNQVKDATIAIADLSATGTPSSTTYLRGDNTWKTPVSVGTSAPGSPATGDLWVDTN